LPHWMLLPSRKNVLKILDLWQLISYKAIEHEPKQ
jgi:hypothetical protein